MANRNAAGGFLVRIETIDGMVRWRNVPNLEHRTLCKAGGFDENSIYFDVSSGFTAGGGVGRGTRAADGLIFQLPRGTPPIGKITLVEEREKFRDENPLEAWRRLGADVPEPLRDGWKNPGFEKPPTWA